MLGFLPSCAETTRLASEALDRRLPFGRWVAFRSHLAICALCRRYWQQLRFLQRAAHTFQETAHRFPSFQLSAEARERMTVRLREASEPSSDDPLGRS